MTQRHIAVVGASLAGLRTVQALRRLGSDARITLVGSESHLPYDRPPLSKEVLLGTAEPESVTLASRVELDALDVDVRRNTTAVGLDLATRSLSLHGPMLGDDRLAFDDLVIATGASARRPHGLAGLDGVHTLRTLDDARAIRRAFDADPRVVVLGGGFIGTEVASAARARGLDVTVVDIAPVLMERALGATIGQRMTAVARDAGVHLRLGASLAELRGNGRIEAVALTDGTVLAADLLVVGVGSTPNVDWLSGSGLRIEDGVVCDEFLSAAPGVHVVGDVARWRHPLYDRTIRCEHWTTTGEHADAVAATLTGTPTSCADVPYVWSDQFGHKLQVAGHLQPGDEARFVTDEPGKFVAIAGSAGVQHAAFALNAPGALVRQRMRLAGAPAWPELADA